MSTLSFRNLDASPSDPVHEWPVEAMQTALERGSLSDFRRIAAEIEDDPWGTVARQVEYVLSYDQPYGTSQVMHNVIVRSRTRAERREKREVAHQVAQAIERSGLTQAEFATRIGTSQPRLSSYASGSVTPSAALLLRMRSVSERAASTPRRA